MVTQAPPNQFSKNIIYRSKMTYYEGGKNNFSQSEAIWGLQSGFGFGDGINLAYFLALEIATFIILWDMPLDI